MDDKNEESTKELAVVRQQAFTFNLNLDAGDASTALTVPQKQELASLAQRQKIELASDVARRQVRLQASAADMAGIFPLCFTKSMKVSAKSSCVAEVAYSET